MDANVAQVRRGYAWVYVKYAPKHSPLYAVQAGCTSCTPRSMGRS